MAATKCPKCSHTVFEVVANTPEGSKFKIDFVQCKSCGTPVASIDYYNTGSLLLEQREHINTMARQVAAIGQTLEYLVQNLNK
ncbi:MAG: hypothetical protein ABSF80_12285 [Chitinispirillaceae bacterium]|jgi:uncharacterized Zn finger protein